MLQLELKLCQSNLNKAHKESAELLKFNTEMDNTIRQQGRDVVTLKGKVDEQGRALDHLRIE